MSTELVITAVVFFVVLIGTILYLVRKRRVSIKYSLVWLFPCFVLIIFTLWPGFMVSITKLVGFQTASNMVITALVCFLLIINLALTLIVTNQKDKIRLLIQEVSIIKSELKKMENNK